jgi:hypothetical protein
MSMVDRFPFEGPLAKFGICSYADPYSPSEIAEFNAVLDPIFQARAGQPRAYVHVDELNTTGLLQRLLSPAMRNILFSIMPDPVLYHCLISEIAGNDTRSHFGSERMSGWHCDADSELVSGEVTHVSIFTYLSQVDSQDGAFEIAPKRPIFINRGAPSILVTGQTGYTFAWQRSFFHRASPNRGPRRRRIFKISVQRNRFPSRHLKSRHFQAALAAIPPGDPGMDVLLGRYEGRETPVVTGIAAPLQSVIQPTGTVDVPISQLLPGQLRFHASRVKESVKAALGKRPTTVAETY